ncbi:hypothetical protein [Mucilaginibacter sp.]|uniref:hypothetical protein n=1 Tax=Mucilaginibacter sp. TaxID=1882438 RepID=UPI003D106954
MDDQLDNDLKNRIREVFDNFEDPTAAEDGWLQLREKFPEEQSKRRAFAWLWWGSVAAILMLILGIGLWMYETRLKNPDHYTAKPAKHPQSESMAANKTQASASNDTSQKTNPVTDNTLAKNTADNTARNKLAAKVPVSNNEAAGRGNALAQNQSPKATVAQKGTMLTQTIDSARTALKTQLAANTRQANATDKTIATPLATTAPLANTADDKTQANLLAGNAAAKQNKPEPANAAAAATAPRQNAPVASVVIKQQPPAKNIMDMFNADQKTQKKEEPIQAKRVHFSVYAATYFNYAKGSQDQVNIGAGFSSDIRLSNNLKLVTGVSIAQNSLSYGGTDPVSLATAQSLVTPATSVAASKYTALTTPSVKNYDASLVGLDIPVNLKYEFNPQKSDTYILAGVSSGTFVDESYTYKYNYPAFLSPSLQKTMDQTTRQSFNSFYFAKTLNVAFGVGYPFGKNRLVIEPFLKYPLDGLGTQNIRFGAGGINLKFNFIPQKKQ